jgi:uncharacterized protein (TIGR03086 family)
MDNIEALQTSRNEFESRLRQIDDDQWDLPTPCDEWSVHDLVNHLLVGTRMSVILLGGGSTEDAISSLGDDLVTSSDDVLADFNGLADAMHAGFTANGGMDGTVNHPMGVIPRAQFVGFRIGDYVAHSWDLARAIGAPEELNAQVVQRAWDDLQPMATMIAEIGLFGEGSSGDVGEDAPLQQRLLDLIGRRP